MTNANEDVESAGRDRPAKASASQGAARPAIPKNDPVVTREMREAGASVIDERGEWEEPFFLAESVYIAMARIGPATTRRK